MRAEGAGLRCSTVPSQDDRPPGASGVSSAFFGKQSLAYGGLRAMPPVIHLHSNSFRMPSKQHLKAHAELCRRQMHTRVVTVPSRHLQKFMTSAAPEAEKQPRGSITAAAVGSTAKPRKDEGGFTIDASSDEEEAGSIVLLLDPFCFLSQTPGHALPGMASNMLKRLSISVCEW